MRLLLVTQRMDEEDPLLGFFVGWVRNLARRLTTLHVVAQDAVTRHVNPNVRVDSLGRERGAGRGARLVRLQGILTNALVRGRSSDVVLCHMCPEYVVAAYPAARLSQTPLFLWYTHGQGSRWLRVAHRLSSGILTASLDGFPFRSPKIVATGHGIDLGKFRPIASPPHPGARTLLSVGRISPIKGHEVPIEALSILAHERGMTDLQLRIIGDTPLASQRWYLEKLRRLVTREKLDRQVRFLGSVPYGSIDRHLNDCDVFLSASNTGSLDKAPLEAMACGKVLLTSNPSFRKEIEGFEDLLSFRPGNSADLAGKLAGVLRLDRDRLQAIGDRLSRRVREYHDLDRLTVRVLEVLRRAV
jgi:glycosyltransferase involved in cell wall biosynthesis